MWLECFYLLTDGGKRMNLVDDRLRIRLLIQFINGILTGPMSRNIQAYQTLKELITNNCHLRNDELASILECIFRHLNHDDDDATSLNHGLNQAAIKRSIEFLLWTINSHVLNITLIHYFIQNIVDLHDKYTFSTGINTELLQLITNHLAKAQWHSISVISVLCGIIVERLETPINNDIDPLSTLLFVLTQTLIDIHQYRLKTQHHVQLSNDDIIHRKCFLNRIQQLPLCWLTILHQVLMKRPNVNIILINFQQFLKSINDKNYSCALNLFGMTVWKMMDEIMKICYQYLIVDRKSTTTTRTLYEDCLNIFEDLANKLCCLPHTIVTHLFDIKRLTSISRTPLREQMIKQSCTKLLQLIRPNNPEWSFALRELIEHIILNPKEAITTRIDVLTTVFDKYLWFKMTDQVTIIGQIILETLENLIHIDLNAITENEFLSKHALMKQNAIKSIFEYFLSDHSIDSNIANHCYKILQEIYEQDCANISSMESIHRPLIEYILEQMCLLFETNLTYTRLTSFNHCSIILNFFIKQVFSNYSKIVSCIQMKIRILIWQLLLNIRIRSSDSRIGMYVIKMERINYGTYRTNTDYKTNENEKFLDLHNYLSNMVDWFKYESSEVVNIILENLCNFLKEQSIVNRSHINIDQLIPLLINMFHDDLYNQPSSLSLNCLIICTCYKNQISQVNNLIDCFIEAMNSSKSSFIIMAIQSFIICLSNLHDEIQLYIPKIILYLTKKFNDDIYISQIILEFLMYLLFENYNETVLICYFFQILIDIINQYQCQTAHNLILSHTILCFYFNQLSMNQRQYFSYFILRSLQETSFSGVQDSFLPERPTRLQRSGSLSSLNDDIHNNDLIRRKMTILDMTPSSQINNLDDNNNNNPLKKLNDELIRITINYLNDHSYELIIPDSILILLPREVRRHHLNNSWLGDEKILYEIKSYDFHQFNQSKDFSINLTHDHDDTMKNRYRRYTDGNKQNVRKNKNLQTLTSCQDDLHIRPLELDTNRSLFNERNLWIAVTVRSFTSTKTFLAINLSASPGIIHTKNEQLHWFEAIKLNDAAADKLKLIKTIPNYWQQEQNNYSINETVLHDELQSIIINIDRKDEEGMLNRHNEHYFPQRVLRVPSEARKSIELMDNVEPVRIAKIGVVYIHPGQEITEINILSNIQTSKRYKQFMLSIAKLKSIQDLQQENFYCPLLDANNSDNCGQYAYIWQNSIYQVLFHTSTMLPNTRSDHEFKKKLIGNDCVVIVYNESDYPFEMKTLKSGVCQYAIEVCPQIDSNYTRIRLKRRTQTNIAQNSSMMDSTLLHNIDYLLSDEYVASYVRTLALCLCQQGELEVRQRSSSPIPFVISPWQNRLQAFRSLHTRCCLSYNN
ncbi:unnamed protein product [Rotaria sordida]|uniref:Rap-GAP domain-containing protein n=1 Tax=Rotaria sordida TaxID=392033 RepID=A0A818VL08_9BILA|nr:unnamed protein product [Rotaria sordida]CAF3709425.1 unnamed protein product [Rotaria sordida]